jgi:hypothetical protein
MTATYTFDVFSRLDGFGSHSGGDWGGYWGKQGPELLDRRLAVYDAEVVARLKEESDVPLRSHDLELIERRTLDGSIQELIYRPTLHG